MSPFHADCEAILKECSYAPSSAKKMMNNCTRSGDIQCTHPTTAQMMLFLPLLQRKHGNRSGSRASLFDQAISRLEEVGSQSGQENVSAEVEAAETIPADANLAEPQLLESLAAVISVEKNTVLKMRRCGNLFCLIDVAAMISGKSTDDAGKQIRIIGETFSGYSEEYYELAFSWGASALKARWRYLRRRGVDYAVAWYTS